MVEVIGISIGMVYMGGLFYGLFCLVRSWFEAG
jgi:hypothetical protein